MGLCTEQATILVKLMDTDTVASRRKRERLITPKHTATGAPASAVPSAA